MNLIRQRSLSRSILIAIPLITSPPFNQTHLQSICIAQPPKSRTRIILRIIFCYSTYLNYLRLLIKISYSSRRPFINTGGLFNSIIVYVFQQTTPLCTRRLPYNNETKLFIIKKVQFKGPCATIKTVGNIKKGGDKISI